MSTEAEAGDTDTDGDGLSDKLEEAIGIDPADNDSDEDGFDDGTEVKNKYDPKGAGPARLKEELISRLKGKILLQVEGHGEAWYVDDNGERYYLKDGAAAYQIMRRLGLGITNEDLSEVPTGDLSTGE